MQVGFNTTGVNTWINGLQKLRWSIWTAIVGAIALVLFSPVLTVLSSSFAITGDVWAHLLATVLPTYIANSCWLLLGVGVGTLGLGVSTAWLVTMCQFPGRGWFQWALLLPLAAPAYILAYTYTEILEFYGPVQTLLREWFGWQSAQDYWFPNVRSLGGAIAMLSLVLYPYVYLPARSAFLNQSPHTLEASRILGCGPWRSFKTVSFPLARPAITAGLSLALMETLNDYGTVQFFAVDTFTTGIYRTWFGMGERLAASQLAGCLLLAVAVLIWLERRSRGQAQYYQSGQVASVTPYHLQGGRAVLATVVCALPIVCGFLLPAGVLLQMVMAPGSPSANDSSDFPSSAAPTVGRFWDLASHSFLLAIATAMIAIAIAIVMAYSVRLHAHWSRVISVRLASLGYAIPGSVIAVGTLVPLGKIDNGLDAWMRSQFGISTGLLLSGTVAALVFAYLVRFLAVALGTVESSLNQIKPSLDEAARSLGHRPLATLVRVHIPLLRSGLITGLILVFVDVMKELPATLIVRPFNFDTLAVHVYNLASDERLAEAAGPALAIVIVGLLPVIFLSNQMTEPGHKN
jgi:iron(III) transport system permease protein